MTDNEVINYIQRRYQPEGSPPSGDWMILIDWIMRFIEIRGGRKALREAAMESEKQPSKIGRPILTREEILFIAKTWEPKE